MNCANHTRYTNTRSALIAVGCVAVAVVWLMNNFNSVNSYLHLERVTEIVHDNATSTRTHKEQPLLHPQTVLKHHPMLMDQNVETLIKNTNSSDYKWLGNHWIAPPGVPTFTPRQIRAYFKKRNVLVIGDSTSRRFYATLFGMFHADDLDNVSVEEISNKTLLDENMHFKDVTKCTLQQNRSIAKHMTAMKGSTCKNWGGDEGEDEDEDQQNSTISSSASLPSGSVKFDYAFQSSFKSMVEFWRDGPNNDNLQGLQNDYDLIIIGIGVWELAHPSETVKPVHLLPNTTAAERVRAMLELMQRNNPNDLQVAIRTSGFGSNNKNPTDQQILRDINAEERQFFYDLETGTDTGTADRYAKNVTLVDWGGVIEHRSYGKERIKGDSPHHYDTEARILFLQQLMHELVKSELIHGEQRRDV